MRILVLCKESELPWYGWGYADAFRNLGCALSFVPEEASRHADLSVLLASCPERPSLILKPDYHWYGIPWGLTSVDIPTVIFHDDVYRFTERRIVWSMLFDCAVVCHTHFEASFRQAGHPNVMTLPIALSPKLFVGPELERDIEVASVGRVDSAIYVTRQRILLELEKHFQMNDWRKRPYTPEEMSEAYRRARIVVNVARDDCPYEANMRVFEVMASGALLLTRAPSELTEIGFQEGVHFVGFHTETEVVPLVKKYLSNESLRRQMTQAARESVIHEHTFECRVRTLLQRIQENPALCAPARRGRWHQVRLAYLDYYSGQDNLEGAVRYFRQILYHSPHRVLRGARLLLPSYLRRLRKRYRTTWSFRCPGCGGTRIKPSPRTGILETYFLPLLMTKPFQSEVCVTRFLHFGRRN